MTQSCPCVLTDFCFLFFSRFEVLDTKTKTTVVAKPTFGDMGCQTKKRGPVVGQNKGGESIEEKRITAGACGMLYHFALVEIEGNFHAPLGCKRQVCVPSSKNGVAVKVATLLHRTGGIDGAGVVEFRHHVVRAIVVNFDNGTFSFEYVGAVH